MKCELHGVCVMPFVVQNYYNIRMENVLSGIMLSEFHCTCHTRNQIEIM